MHVLLGGYAKKNHNHECISLVVTVPDPPIGVLLLNGDSIQWLEVVCCN